MSDDRKTSILVVDDVPEKLLAMRTILEELGQEIVCVRSGREALGALLEQDFAVILLDVNMPAMDGFETAALMRRRKRSEHTPIIFLTAYGDEHHMWQGYSLGAVDYILTPVVPEVLRAKVAVFVDLFRKSEQIKRQAQQQVELASARAARSVAEAASRRSSFLADASDALARSLDYQATIATLLRTPVPMLCESTVVIVAPTAGAALRGELGRRDGEGRWQQTALAPAQIPAPLQELVQQVLADGQPRRLEKSLSFEAAAAGGEPPPGVQSAMVMPLIARGRTLGVFCLMNSVSGAPFRDDDLQLAGELAGRGATAIDNARLYREIQEGDRRKDEFLALLGHELRNPLGAISSALEVLSLNICDDSIRDVEVLHMAKDVVQRQFQQMERLVDDLLDVSRITRGKIQLRHSSLELRSVVASATATVRSLVDSRQQELSVTLPETPLPLVGDPARLEQVLTNLLNNASKYTEASGQIWLSAAREDDEVVIRVRDTGIGMPAPLLHQVFEPFVQGDRALDRSLGGLGIGLTLVRTLVEMHGGTIQAFSAGTNRGSEFVIRLPAAAEVSPPSPLPPPPAAVEVDRAAEGRRVLVVDDNADLMMTITLLLQRIGYDVQSAADGLEAIRVAREFCPEIVLVDIGLPGLNGYQVAEHLRGFTGFEKTLLIAMSGYGQPEDRRKAQAAGFDHHLVKPVPFEELQELLRESAAPSSSATEMS